MKKPAVQHSSQVNLPRFVAVYGVGVPLAFTALLEVSLVASAQCRGCVEH